MTAIKTWELNSFVDALARCTEGLSDSKDNSESIENAQNWPHEISQGFRSARDDYDRIVPELEAVNSASNSSWDAMKEL